MTTHKQDCLSNNNNHLCFYRNSNGMQSCMPRGGIINLEIRGMKAGDIYTSNGGPKWQVVKCKFPNCI